MIATLSIIRTVRILLELRYYENMLYEGRDHLVELRGAVADEDRGDVEAARHDEEHDASTKSARDPRKPLGHL